VFKIEGWSEGSEHLVDFGKARRYIQITPASSILFSYHFLLILWQKVLNRRFPNLETLRQRIKLLRPRHVIGSQWTKLPPVHITESGF
jgi:hypothetical protein